MHSQTVLSIAQHHDRSNTHDSNTRPSSILLLSTSLHKALQTCKYNSQSSSDVQVHNQLYRGACTAVGCQGVDLGVMGDKEGEAAYLGHKVVQGGQGNGQAVMS